MYKAIFDSRGNRITSYRTDIHTNIPSEAIEISDADQALYATNEYIRGADGRPQLKPPYVPTLDELKAAKLLEIDTWTAQHITTGFVSTAAGAPHKYDSEKEDQQNLILMLQAALSADFATHPVYQGHIPIRAIPEGQAEKIILQHDAAQIQAVVNDMSRHIGSCKQIGWQLQAAVAAATTKEELNVIVWPE